MGFQVSRLEPQGIVSNHLHSFEESFYVIDGELIVDLPEGSFRVGTGDYGLIPVGVTHSLRNLSPAPVSFAEMRAPLPRERHGFDTYLHRADAVQDRDHDRRQGPEKPELRAHRP